LYAKNVSNLALHVYQNGLNRPDVSDEIVKGCMITDNGAIVQETVRQGLVEKGAIPA
jgi:hypothetical protein